MNMTRWNIPLSATAIAGAVAMGYFYIKRQAVERIHAGSQLVSTCCGIIEYATTDERKPEVLMVHGAGGGYDQGLLFASLLSHTPFCCIAPSRFGYLRTPLPSRANPIAQAEAYEALLDALDIERVVVIAVSAGGPSALQFALRYPDRCSGLVLISALSRPVPPPPRAFKKVFQATINSDVFSLVSSHLAAERLLSLYGVEPALMARLRQEPEKWKMLLNILTMTFPIGLRKQGMSNDLKQASALPVDSLDTISAPTLVVHGTHDPVVPFSHAQFVLDTLPHAELVTVAGGDHFCVVTHREQVVPPVVQFLEQHAAAVPAS
jgi:pimeloyl-ACP methyl ester carboxylesterase